MGEPGFRVVGSPSDTSGPVPQPASPSDQTASIYIEASAVGIRLRLDHDSAALELRRPDRRRRERGAATPARFPAAWLKWLIYDYSTAPSTGNTAGHWLKSPYSIAAVT